MGHLVHVKSVESYTVLKLEWFISSCTVMFPAISNMHSTHTLTRGSVSRYVSMLSLSIFFTYFWQQPKTAEHREKCWLANYLDDEENSNLSLARHRISNPSLTDCPNWDWISSSFLEMDLLHFATCLVLAKVIHRHPMLWQCGLPTLARCYFEDLLRLPWASCWPACRRHYMMLTKPWKCGPIIRCHLTTAGPYC